MLTLNDELLKFNRPYLEEYSKIGLDCEEVSITDMDKKWVIVFEGADATGKQTLSTNLAKLLNSYFKEDTVQKIEIPDYDLPSGKEIKNILFTGNYNPELLQLKFALNRKEVQNEVILNNKLLAKNKLPEKNTIIFDRWVDSGIIFRLAKQIHSDLKEFSDKEFMNEEFNSEIIDLIFKYKDLLNKQLELEHNILKLVKPNLKILCTTPVEVISKRLRDRLLNSGVAEKDIEENLDSHEKDLSFLYIAQFVYTYVYSNPKEFFSSEIFGSRKNNILILDTYKNNPEECMKLIMEKLESF